MGVAAAHCRHGRARPGRSRPSARFGASSAHEQLECMEHLAFGFEAPDFVVVVATLAKEFSMPRGRKGRSAPQT
jgi:hypothetical protein